MELAEIAGLIGIIGGLFSIASQLGKLLKACYRLSSDVEQTQKEIVSLRNAIDKSQEDTIDLRLEVERLNVSVQKLEIFLIKSGYVRFPDPQ